MSKSKSRQPSKQASLASTATGKRSENATGAVQLAEEAQDTAKLADNASVSTKEKQTALASKPASVPSGSKALTRDAAKYARRQAAHQTRLQAQRRARRIRNTIITIVALVVIVGGGLTAYFFYSTQHTAQATSATSFTPFTEPIFDSDFQPVDNVYCDQLEQSVEHIHVHLSIYINGQSSPLPANIGIPSTTDPQSGQSSVTCFYWLHVHDTSGVIHIESPSTEPFTLGQFIDEWNQQFNTLGFPQQLLLSSGWTIWVNGQPYHGSLDSVQFNAHDLITIAYQSPNVKPDTTYAWPSGE